MLPGPGEETRTCAKDSNVAKLKENECVGCQDRQRKTRMKHR